MRLATVQQAQQIDEISQSVYGLTGEVLMEAAGALTAHEVALTFLPELSRGAVGVVAGPGNNGGDALVVARHLHSAGFRDLTVFTIAPEGAQSALFKVQKRRAELQGLRLVDLIETPARAKQMKSAELIVDGVFGIGLNKPIAEPYLAVIEAINASRAPKVALDTPSGLNCLTGRVEGACVRAAETVTFGLAKPGFFISEGPALVGKLRVLPIGFPHEALRGIANTHFLFTEKLARRYLPVRSDLSNKSDHGRLLLIAGRPGYWGAGILSGSSAYRMGTGYVTWASFEPPYEALKEIPEILTGDVHDERLWSDKISAVAIGPGLGAGIETARVLEKLKKLEGVPVVVDADALTACVEHQLFPLPTNWIITPHTGEMARILKISAPDIEKNRLAAAFAAFEKVKCHVLLKGFRSIMAYENRAMIVQAGNSALAKAGTGDVLTGMIGGLLAQGLNTAAAGATASYLHGRLADEWVRNGQDKAAMTASDLKALLPQVLSRIRLGGTLF